MNRDRTGGRWVLPLIGLVGLGAGLLIGLVASGDGDTETTTTTVVSTTTRDGGDGARRTRTVRRGRTRTRTVVRTQTVTVGGGGRGRPVSVPGGGRTFSGRNGRTIGTLRVPRRSTIRWTNRGDVFTLLSERQIHVSSTKRSGRATLQRGTYNDFRVAALGSWTLRIIPR